MSATESIRDISRDYAESVVIPFLADRFPGVLSRATVGFLGHGSDVLGLDDALSRDHHFGVRVDLLLDESDRMDAGEAIARGIAGIAPPTWRGVPMRIGHVGRSGCSVDSRRNFLRRTIGLERAPESFEEWLSVPEEDVIHVVSGQVWRDESEEFGRIREAFGSHWPHRVRLRRIAHWCRMSSGMGTYALQRAVARGDAFYACTRFASSLRWMIQLAFLIDKVYFPYDKWLVAFVPKLGAMRGPVEDVLDATLREGVGTVAQLALLEDFATRIDAALVEQGVVAPHPRWNRSDTSGWRLLEHAYARILSNMTETESEIVPAVEQIPLESFHARYVRGVSEREWLELLGLAESAGK